MELEKTICSQTTFRGTTHYHLNRTSASIQIIQRAERIIDNFIYEILDKLVDDECKIAGSLIIISAFSLAKNAPIDDSTDNSTINIEEDWYKTIPFQFRRWVLLQHLVEFHIEHVKIPWIIKSMIDACLDKELSYQGFELLKAYWNLTGASSTENARYIMHCVEIWRKKESWFQFISLNIRERDVGDVHFFEIMDVTYKIRLLKLLIQVIIDAVNLNRLSSLDVDVCHSHFSCFNTIFQSGTQILSDILHKANDIMNALVHLIKLPIETAIGLLVQGIIHLENTCHESMGLWCSHLSELLIDQHIDNIMNISAKQFIQLAKHLESYSYYEAAIKILVFLEHKIMQNTDLKDSLEECQYFLGKLKDRVQLNPAYGTKFNLRYEPMLDSWIACTPKPLSKQDKPTDCNIEKDDGTFLRPNPKIPFTHPLSHSYSPDPLLGISSNSYNTGITDFHDGLSSSGEETPRRSIFVDKWNENSSPTPQVPIKRNASMIFSPKRKNIKNISIVTPLPRNNEEDELL